MNTADLVNRGLNKARSSVFVRNTAVVMSGTIVAQALGFALSPVISRLFSPADFGVFGSFSAFVRIVVAAVTLEYSQALVLPKRSEDAYGLFVLSCASTVVMSLLLAGAYLITPAYFNTIVQASSSWVLLPILSSVVVSGVNQACQAWCIRAKEFKATSASQIVRSLSANGMQAGLGVLNGGSGALIWSSVVGDLLATANLVRTPYRDFRTLSHGFTPRRALALAREYGDFPIYSASMNVVNALSMGLPVFLLTHYYGVAVAGGYSFALRVLSMPMEFVLRALRQVLYQKAAETYNDGRKLTPLYVKITSALFGMAVIPSLFFVIWSPQIFGFVFGGRWVQAGEFARALVVWMLFMFCNLPATLFARIIRVQDKMFVYDLSLLGLRTGALVLGGLFLSPAWTIMGFAVVGGVMNVLFIVIIGFLLAKREKFSGIGDLVGVFKESSG